MTLGKREEIAIQLHTLERILIRIIDETAALNCSWEKLSEHNREAYRTSADQILAITGEYEEVELPHPSIETKSKAEEAKGWTLAQDYAYRDAQQDILKLCGGKIYRKVKGGNND